METSVYAVEAEVENTHWWFVVRRRFFAAIIRGLGLPNSARVLDIGTSTGTNLRMLGEMGFKNFIGLDMHDEAVRWCAEKKLGKVEKGDICAMPFGKESFDLVLATDIIEHIVDDKKALLEIQRVLKPGGAALISVPAFQSLWGLQDDVSMHQRRYVAAELKQLFDETGWKIEKLGYFNYLLFLPIWLARQVIRIFKIPLKSENQLNNPVINRILVAIFSADIASLKYIRPPFGVSLLALVRKER